MESSKIVVQTHWNERELVKQIPGAGWDNDAKVWTVPLTWPACIQLRGIFGQQLTIGQLLQHWAYVERERRVDKALALRNLTEAPMPPSDDRLRLFQRAGVNFMYVGESIVLGDDMGSGKTI